VASIVAGLKYFNDELTRREIVSAFAFAPVDNVDLSAAFLATGYRKTGLLAKGVLVGGLRRDAILWSRKLADPSGGAEAELTEDE
jgi:hypothetical protein